MSLCLRTLAAWQQYMHRMDEVATASQVPTQLHVMALQLRQRVLLRRVFEAWHDHHMEHSEPKVCSRSLTVKLGDLWITANHILSVDHCNRDCWVPCAGLMALIQFKQADLIDRNGHVFAKLLTCGMRPPRRWPQIFARRRAARLCARTLLIRGWRSWQAFIPRSREKRALNAWLQHRRLAGLLRACWSAWMQRAGRARAVRVAAALARRRHASQLLRTWHVEARRSALLRQAVRSLGPGAAGLSFVTQTGFLSQNINRSELTST